MRINNADRKFGQPLHHGFDVAYPHSGVEQDRSLTSHDKIRDHFFELVRLINREYALTNPVHLEPRVRTFHPLKLVVSRSRLALAPVRHLRRNGSQQPESEKNTARKF